MAEGDMTSLSTIFAIPELRQLPISYRDYVALRGSCGHFRSVLPADYYGSRGYVFYKNEEKITHSAYIEILRDELGKYRTRNRWRKYIFRCEQDGQARQVERPHKLFEDPEVGYTVHADTELTLVPTDEYEYECISVIGIGKCLSIEISSREDLAVDFLREWLPELRARIYHCPGCSECGSGD
jgi:hypothetical protein